MKFRYRIIAFFVVTTILLVFGGTSGLRAEVKMIQPLELQAFRKKNPQVQIIDVRETWERKRGKIPRSKHIRLVDMSSAKLRLNMDYPVVVYCRSGRRSQHGAEILNKLGFTEVYKLEGGINAYSQEVDSSIPQY